jgi:hypothetical protein
MTTHISEGHSPLAGTRLKCALCSGTSRTADAREVKRFLRQIPALHGVAIPPPFEDGGTFKRYL